MEKLNPKKARLGLGNKKAVKNVLVLVACGLSPLFMPAHPSIWASSPPALGVNQAAQNSESQQLLVQGVEQLDADQWDAALESFQQTLTIQRQLGNLYGEAVALNNLGIVYYYQGNYEQAIALFRESMQIFWDIDERSGIGASLNNQSITSLRLEDYQKAIELCHGAIAIFRTMGDHIREAAALNNMGFVYESLGEYGRGIGYFQEALVTAQDHGDRSGEVLALSNLKEAYQKLGQADQAMVFEQQALVTEQQMQANPERTVSSNDNLLIRQNERSLVLIFY